MSLKLKIVSHCYDGTIDNMSYSNELVWEIEENWNAEVKAKLQEPQTDTSSDKTYYKECSISLLEMSFDKQLYRPCEIHARMQISQTDATQGDDKSYFLFTQNVLNINFQNCKVSLDVDGNNIAKDYLVHQIVPEYSASSLYVDLIIYSPDYALTTGTESAVYVTKKLFNQIADAKLSNITHSIQPENQLLKGSDGEYMQPYLVQYNESFYDFLCRTANRWGEFVYFEDGTLQLGRKQFSKSDGSNDDQTVSTYKSISGYNANEAIKISDDTKDFVIQDDYLDTITRDSYINHYGDMIAGDEAYHHKVMQSFLGLKSNVFDWAFNLLMDDGTTAAQNKKYLKKIKKKYNEDFFDKELFKDYYNSSTKQDDWVAPNKDEYPQYSFTIKNTDKIDWSKDITYCQFADLGSPLTSDNYKTILKNEQTSGAAMVCVDFGENYQHLRLGDKFQFDGNTSNTYVVVRVEGFVTKKPKITQDKDGNYQYKETTSLMQYKVYAVAAISGKFYPPVLPTGHVRFSGPQLATIKETNDPALKNRYRVKLNWQSSGDTVYSPWIRMSREMISKNSGAVWQLEQDTEVLVDFEGGNIERPYIVGALQNENVARSTHFNNMDLVTPHGHAIRLTDGYGVGGANFGASFVPLANMIKGFYPDEDSRKQKRKTDSDKCYEGGVELTDKWGIYSIKASSDQRNISLKSPYGDININAFTGITINAPNGDLKICGKNVSIEAGNRLTLTSGKNIGNGLLAGAVMDGQIADQGTNDQNFGLGVLTNVVKVFGDKALGWIDMPVLRHGIEVVLRPVAGVMTLRSLRFMELNSGISPAHAHKPIAGSEKKATWSGNAADSWLQQNNLYNFATQLVPRFADNKLWNPNGADTGDIWFIREKDGYTGQNVIDSKTYCITQERFKAGTQGIDNTNLPNDTQQSY